MTTVLIIDDSPEERELLTDLLHQHDPGIGVTACVGGADGLAQATWKIFDCVLLDLRLDGEDGIDVLTRLKKARLALPVIVLTGQGNEATATDAFVAGAAFYLPKSGLTSETLWTAIERVIQQAETERELKAKREAMERSNRLDAVGQLAAGIAHDFNNQLGTLRMSIELLKEVAVTAKSKEHVGTAIKIIDESAHLATRLVALSRQGDLFAADVFLRDALEDTRALAAMSVAEQVILDMARVDTDLVVHCDPGQLLNAVLNLILNANDAIVSKGEIGTISVTASQGVNEVSIRVKDNGVGMRQEVLDKCSDPFFTTKRDRNGTGLGLAMVQGFANENGGRLILNSTPGVGTEAILVLAQGTKTAPRDKIAPVVTPHAFANANILLVEDMFVLAAMTQDVLEDAGFTVNLVSDAEKAIAYLGDGQTVDLLITDIKMSGMNGFDLAKQVRRDHPGIKTIYLTGYSDTTELQREELLGPILQKPVEPEELIATIKKILAEQG